MSAPNPIKERKWPVVILAGGGRFLIVCAGLAALLLLAQYAVGFRETAESSVAWNEDERPATRVATVQDVLAAAREGRLRAPSRPHNDFPGRCRYDDAFPPGEEGVQPARAPAPENVVREFSEAPILRDVDRQRRLRIRQFTEEWDDLPPVEERIPLYPAVMVGPDGPGRYGGRWRRAANDNDLGRKIGYPTLVRFDPKGDLQPHFAYKWKVENQNRMYTFWLRRGHRWSDGHPFTAHDVAWICNVLIGSDHWPDPPDWMGATDGSILLYDDDIRDWPGLARAVLRQMEDETPSPGRQMAAIFAVEPERWNRLRALLEDIAHNGRPSSEDIRAEFVGFLNQLFENPKFYDPQAWKDVDLTSDLDALMRKGVSRLHAEERDLLEILILRNDLAQRLNLSSEWRALQRRKTEGDLDEKQKARIAQLAPHADSLERGMGDLHPSREIALLKRANVMLFRAAYAACVEPPRRRRVRVEAPSDDVLRFVFDKPNSFFLEKTATFMFYTGLFGIPPHIWKPWHPDGSRLLVQEDILDWPAFLRALAGEEAGDGPTPGSHLASLMPLDLVQQIRSAAGSAPPESLRQAVLEELNRLLRLRDFFDERAWRSVDFDSERRELEAHGYSRLSDRRLQRRYLELLQTDDLRRRGVAELKDSGADEADNELLTFNAAMFRAAFSAPGPALDTPVRLARSIVAFSREVALDLQAQRDPLKFDTWVDRLRRINQLRTRMHLPVLTPWRVVTDPNEIVSVAIRNPYYFAVDSEGRQLPYLDTVESEEQPRRPTRNLKLTSGNVDFQVRDINFSDFTILKQNERRGNYRVLLWAYDYVGEVVFYFPQPRADEEMARLQDDPRFRHALSYAINRQEIIEVVFRGLGEPAQVSVPLGSPFYNERHARTAVEYRPELANRLLDEMGLNRRAADGTRLLWSGRPLILVVAVDETRSLDAVQMVCNYWQAVGVNAQMKVQTMVLINNWNAMGLLDVGVAREGGNFFGPVVASNYAPTHPAECVWASKWTEWLVSAGQRGWEPPERFKRLEVLWRRVVEAPTREAMIAAWQALSEHTAEQLPTIGITTPPGAVVYVRNGFKNVPELSLAGWIAHDPGNNCPEVFFWENGGD